MNVGQHVTPIGGSGIKAPPRTGGRILHVISHKDRKEPLIGSGRCVVTSPILNLRNTIGSGGAESETGDTLGTGRPSTRRRRGSTVVVDKASAAAVASRQVPCASYSLSPPFCSWYSKSAPHRDGPARYAAQWRDTQGCARNRQGARMSCGDLLGLPSH